MGLLTIESEITKDELEQIGFHYRWDKVYIYEEYIKFKDRKRAVFKIYYWPNDYYWPNNSLDHIKNKAVVSYMDRFWNSNPKYYEISNIGDLKILIHLAKEGKAED